MRKLLAASPLRRPADFRGVSIAMQRSRLATLTFAALGARPAAIPAGAPIGAYDAVEQQLISMADNGYDQSAANLTANVNLWPRPVVIFANPDAFGRLDARQQRALRDAAQVAMDPTIAFEQRGDADGAEILCRRGVRFVSASSSDLGALRSAVAPVIEGMAKDPDTKAAIAEIRGYAAEARTSADVPACATTPSPESNADTSPIDGTYRSNVSLKQLKRTPGYEDGEDNPGNTGHFRLELSHGHFRLSGSADGVDQEGRFAVAGDVLTFLNWANETDFSYRWSLYRGELTLKKTGEGPTTFAVHPWRRQGD
jgi:hypothetical protein